MKIKLIKNYYDVGYDLYEKDEVDIEPGLTVLVGANGTGKTTFLRMIKQLLKNQDNTLIISYDNLMDGGNYAKFVTELGSKIRKSSEKSIWILLDAMDSGYSIDNIVNMKKFFRFLLNVEEEKDIYILVSANSYELARHERCLDVHRMVYRTFSDYGDYRTFILHSRERRDYLERK